MSAVISLCGLYRYRLDRGAPEGKTVLFIGVNPSTANATEDDPTIRKMVGFAQRWGYSRVIVANLFAYRATDPRQLAKVGDPHGPDWMMYLEQCRNLADLIVPCWGSREKLPKGMQGIPAAVLDYLQLSGKPVRALGLTKLGDPRHPLYLPYHTPLIELPGADE